MNVVILFDSVFFQITTQVDVPRGDEEIDKSDSYISSQEEVASNGPENITTSSASAIKTGSNLTEKLEAKKNDD